MLDLVLSIGTIAASAGCVILTLQIKAMLHAQQSQQQQIMQTLQEQLQSCLSRLESQGQTHLQLVSHSAQQSHLPRHLDFPEHRMQSFVLGWQQAACFEAGHCRRCLERYFQ